MSTSYADSGGGTRSLPTLRETVDTVSLECPARLGISAKELQAKSPSIDDFFDAIAAERLRRMPADGSRLDSALCRASRLAFAVGSLRDSVVSFMSGADEATSMIWGATLLLLEVSRGVDAIAVGPALSQPRPGLTPLRYREALSMSIPWTVSSASTVE